ncbi:MAG: MBL fold metallo-hydrolase [Fibrobacter sp.]|jgi:glyoxylase-like metal-dependent hydrolase (beta-lactamase superfamily II)|nr:MBL fold metallo-hydrolase [Fibrobacter sp.]
MAKLNFEVYNPGSKSVFAVTSTIIEGPTEVALIDAQFQSNDAKMVAEKIKSKNKKLTFVFISHSDPDYYFGLEAIKDAFPDVKIIATQKVHDAISGSMDDKLAYWGAILKDNAPRQLILPEITDQPEISVDGVQIAIRDGYLWVPSEKTVLGGVLVDSGMHIWLADSQSQESREKWIKVLDGMIALNPENVIAGHFWGDYKKGTESVSFTKKYIGDFNNAAERSKNAEELISMMKEKYKNLPGEDSLTFSAKVIKNEAKWPAVPAFPGVGKKVEVNFGEAVFMLQFHDETKMSYVGTSGAYKGATDSVVYKAVEIRSGLYMVYWTESTKTMVVHIEDYERGQVYTNIANMDGSFLHMSGTLRVAGDIK